MNIYINITMIKISKVIQLLLLTFLVQISVNAQPGPEQRFDSTDLQISDRFGQAIDVDGEFAVIGAPGFNIPQNPGPGTHFRAGAVYVFRYISGQWVEIQKLTASTPSQDDFFGLDVAIKNNLIVVGAPGDNETQGGGVGTDSGAAYIFEWNGTNWQQIEKLLPDASSASILMGTSVDIDISIPDEGNLPEQTNIVVGAPLFDSAHGVVFLYRRTNDVLWERIGELQDDDTAIDERGQLGTSVSLVGDLILAGAPEHKFGKGTAYGFGRGQIIGSWTQSMQYEPIDLAGSEKFGFSVTVGKIGDEYIVTIGAPGVSALHVGRVFIYDSNNDPHELTELNTHKYGHAVAIYENNIAIGAFGDDSLASNAGAVYLQVRDNLGAWQDNGMIVASDPGVDKQFGFSTALNNGVLVIGSPSFNTIPRAGASYFYTDFIFRNGFEAINP